LRNRTRVDLAGGARFLGWELSSLGRPAIGERFDAGNADLGLAVFREGRPLLLERLRLDDTSALDGASGLRGFPVCATLVASGAEASDLAAARGGLDATAGLPFAMTLLDDLLVARCLANGVEPVRRTFLGLWAILRTRLMGRVACPPRIWAT
jgi:urease accessory protein